MTKYLFLANPHTDLKTKSNEHEMTQLRSKYKLLLKAAASSAKKDGLVTEVFLRQVESRPRLVSQVHHLTHQVTSLSLSSSSPTHYPTTLFSTPLWLSWTQFHLLISPDPAFLPWMSEPAVRAHRLQPLPRICKVWDIMSLEVWWWWCDNMIMMI